MCLLTIIRCCMWVLEDGQSDEDEPGEEIRLHHPPWLDTWHQQPADLALYTQTPQVWHCDTEELWSDKLSLNISTYISYFLEFFFISWEIRIHLSNIYLDYVYVYILCERSLILYFITWFFRFFSDCRLVECGDSLQTTETTKQQTTKLSVK